MTSNGQLRDKRLLVALWSPDGALEDGVMPESASVF